MVRFPESLAPGVHKTYSLDFDPQAVKKTLSLSVYLSPIYVNISRMAGRDLWVGYNKNLF